MNNKSNRTAIALIVGLIICAVLFALLAPKTFNWDLPPQNRNTEQPFCPNGDARCAQPFVPTRLSRER